MQGWLHQLSGTFSISLSNHQWHSSQIKTDPYEASMCELFLEVITVVWVWLWFFYFFAIELSCLFGNDRREFPSLYLHTWSALLFIVFVLLYCEIYFRLLGWKINSIWQSWDILQGSSEEALKCPFIYIQKLIEMWWRSLGDLKWLICYICNWHQAKDGQTIAI